MSISKVTTTARSSIIDVRRFVNNNHPQKKVNAWKYKSRRKTGKALDNAHRLQLLEKKDFGPNVVEAYRAIDMRKLTRIESYLVVSCIIAAMLFTIGAMLMPVLLILTVFTSWFSTIAYRFYRHHMNCYSHLIELNAHRCPHCGKPLMVDQGVEQTSNGYDIWTPS